MRKIQRYIFGRRLVPADAQRMWAHAIEKGWMDDRWKPLISQTRAAILASVMGEGLNLAPQWPPFEQLWRIPDLGTKCCKARECEYFPALYKDMKIALLRSEE